MCTKVKFATESFALDYIKRLQKHSDRDKIPLRCYFCEICKAWHLTSLKANVVSKIEHDEIVTKLKNNISNLELQNKNLISRCENQKNVIKLLQGV